MCNTNAYVYIYVQLLKLNSEIDYEVKYKRFQFMGPDISIDSFGNVRIIDANVNGYILPGSFFNLAEDLRNGLQIIGVDGFPKSSNADTSAAIAEAVQSFCGRVNCQIEGDVKAVANNMGGEEMLRELLHETVHLCGWTRIFPVEEYVVEPFMRLFHKTGLFEYTERDRLLASFVASKEFKKFTHGTTIAHNYQADKVVALGLKKPRKDQSNANDDMVSTFLPSDKGWRQPEEKTA